MPTEEIFSHLKSLGFKPEVVIDVGAGDPGDEVFWALEAFNTWPEAYFVLVDGDPDSKEMLQLTCEKIKSASAYTEVLSHSAGVKTDFWQMGAGSSLYEEKTNYPRHRLRVTTTTLDTLVSASDLIFAGRPALLKLDVQGAELDVLRGATETLQSVEVLFLETTLIPYNEGAPLLHEVILWLAERGFVVFDFGDGFRRATDGVLFQIDVIFVRKDSPLRAFKKVWLDEPEFKTVLNPMRTN